MGHRDLITPRQRQALADVLSGCLLSELLAPSEPLWLVSAWVSDIEAIDNAGGAFEALAPDWPRGPIRLSTVLARIVELGGSIFVGMNNDVHNESFIERLKSIHRFAPLRVRWAVAEQLHQKCLCGSRFALRGSMNVTWNGLNAKEEQMTLTTTLADVQRLRLELNDRWFNAAETFGGGA
ncbi:phospholipase D-like domain-containing protein DpdK [Burkholderia gladioli]|uniref:phospholipase D-like domain-containing protein DpdK n=1 Tax=Burkholderia gladioli TaxID=28095 RepID=UPI002FDF9640